MAKKNKKNKLKYWRGKVKTTASTLNNNIKKVIKIYSDGSGINSGGIGGWGVSVEYQPNPDEAYCIIPIEQYGSYKFTTNNRMEIIGTIRGLEIVQRMQLKEPTRILVYSDSQYVVNSISKGWIRKWKANGWCRYDIKTGERLTLMNADLWQQLDKLMESLEAIRVNKPGQCNLIEFLWIPGHSGNGGNDRADALAKLGFGLPMEQKLDDDGYRIGQDILANDIAIAKANNININSNKETTINNGKHNKQSKAIKANKANKPIKPVEPRVIQTRYYTDQYDLMFMDKLNEPD